MSGSAYRLYLGGAQRTRQEGSAPWNYPFRRGSQRTAEIPEPQQKEAIEQRDRLSNQSSDESQRDLPPTNSLTVLQLAGEAIHQQLWRHHSERDTQRGAASTGKQHHQQKLRTVEELGLALRAVS